MILFCCWKVEQCLLHRTRVFHAAWHSLMLTSRGRTTNLIGTDTTWNASWQRWLPSQLRSSNSVSWTNRHRRQTPHRTHPQSARFAVNISTQGMRLLITCSPRNTRKLRLVLQGNFRQRFVSSYCSGIGDKVFWNNWHCFLIWKSLLIYKEKLLIVSFVKMIVFTQSQWVF